MKAGAAQPIQDEATALTLLEQTLTQAVRQQSLADVPLGAFLSGGVDSSMVVALMQQQSARPVQTFTVGFDEAGFDEYPHARAVAEHLGTDHHELFVTSAEAREVIPCLPTFYDEPFADSSQIPTHLVCKAARRRVTVALSGDGGDELFGGYNRYFWGPRIWDRLAWLPYPMRQGLGKALLGIPIHGWDTLAGPINRLRPGNAGFNRLGDRVHKLATRLRHVRDLDDLYLSLVSEWTSPEILQSRGQRLMEPASLLADPLPPVGMHDPALRMMFRDSLTYLPDDILCKVDRAAMSVSLETRVPLLDHRVVELAWRLPLDMKIREGAGKWALRQVLYRHVPKALIERPKAGFSIPVGAWLRGPLRDWAENLLDARRLEAEGYFNPSLIHKVWAEHLSGRRDWTPRLWAILMFQAWLSQTT